MTYQQPWTKAHLDQLKKAGKIQGHNFPEKKIDRRLLLRKKGKQWYWIASNFFFWASEQKAKDASTEFQFHGKRKWRFDFAVPSRKVAVEYEGIFSSKSRHTTFSGYTGDADKYNAAAADGWIVIRLTAKNYKTLWDHLKNIKPNEPPPEQA